MISKFYWYSSDTTDNTNIAKGQPISNLKATAWNRMIDKIQEVQSRRGSSQSTLSDVYRGEIIQSTLFNQVRNAIGSLPGASTIPDTKSVGQGINAADFNGSSSLKGGLNRAIDNFNNSL